MQFRCLEANKIFFIIISVGSFQQAISLARNQMSGLSLPRIANISAKSAQLLLNRREQLTPVTCSPLEVGRGSWYLSVSLGNKGPLAGHLNATHSWVSCRLKIAKHVETSVLELLW